MTARSRHLVLVVALLAIALPAARARAATTRFAAPTGAGNACSEKEPCTIAEALNVAVTGDSVELEPGTYVLASAVSVAKGISFGGAPGAYASTVIQTTSANNFRTNLTAKPALHDLTIRGTGGFVLNSGSAERFFVDFTGNTSTGCAVNSGTTLTDSVCWAHGSSSSDALEAQEVNGKTGSVVLRNDTLVSDNPGGSGLNAEARNSNSVLLLEATNVIARGQNEDVQAMTGGSGFRVVTVTLTNSSYAKIETEPLLTSVTEPGTKGNQTAAPTFVAAGSGNFAEAAGSPTIDAGLIDVANGAIAVGGESRVLPACIGGPAVTDIGAYEFVPSDACPTPPGSASTAPAAQAPPATPPSNAIKLGKLTKNARRGTATLLVSVPGAGVLTLSGKGVKKVSRSSKGAAQLRLPIKPVGSAKRRLLGSGRAKLKLNLSFLPIGGSSGSRSRSVQLTERLR